MKQLASSGQLKPSDLVWQTGMTSWKPASGVEGLVFPPPTEDEPPPIPPEDTANLESPPPVPSAKPKDGYWAKNALASTATSLLHRGQSAGQLLKKLCERANLRWKLIPNAYRVLGEQVHSQGAYRADFPSIYVRLDGLLAEIAYLKERPVGEQQAAPFAVKVLSIARIAHNLPHTQLIKSRVTNAFRELGNTAFAKYGENSGPKELVQQIVDCRKRLDTLDTEIRDLLQSQPGQIVTPKRILIAGGVVIVLLLLFAFFGTKGSR